MWLCGVGLQLLRPGLHPSCFLALLKGPYQQMAAVHLRPQALYTVHAEPPWLRRELGAHRNWCLRKRGVASHAACQPPLDHLAPFYCGLTVYGRSGTVRPLELDQPYHQVHCTLRWNPRILPTLAPADLCLHFKAACLRQVVLPSKGSYHYRYYPEPTWQRVHWPLRYFHCTTTPHGRWVKCELGW